MMSLKDELLQILESLAPNITDQERATLELEPAAMDISSLLSEPFGMKIIEYISKELYFGSKNILTVSVFVNNAILKNVIKRTYDSGEQEALDILLSLYHQSSITTEGNSGGRDYHATLDKLKISKAVENLSKILSFCIECFSICSLNSTDCPKCEKNKIVDILGFSLTQPARDVLKNNQYLEIYVKECLSAAQIELVGYIRESKRGKVYTSIRYQIEGEEIDIDIHGLSNPLALWLCEVKTSGKVTMNELRRIEGLYNRFMKVINKSGRGTFNPLFLFVTTGEFDQNISFDAYQRKGWAFLDRSKIQPLVKEINILQKSL